ncbi:MAG TPA: PrgI family protein [Candidatus Paceibacterota bacterium]|nr:PrgI family protein [Candidatus Paceibacterota bacterium]
MQFKVPQFIDVEDKVVGPFTFRQFIYLAGGVGAVYLSFKILPALIALFVAPVFAALAVALTFYKYNDKPFINLLESLVRFYARSRLYLWHKQAPSPQKKESSAPTSPHARAALTESKLKTLSWSLDVIDPKSESSN